MISWQHHREKTPHVEGTDGQDRTLQQPGFVAADLGYPQVINAMNTSESFNFIQLRSSIVESRYRGGPHPSQPRLRCNWPYTTAIEVEPRYVSWGNRVVSDDNNTCIINGIGWIVSTTCWTQSYHATDTRTSRKFGSQAALQVDHPFCCTVA